MIRMRAIGSIHIGSKLILPGELFDASKENSERFLRFGAAVIVSETIEEKPKKKRK